MVLHAAPVVVLVVGLHLLLVGHHQLVVFLKVLVAALAYRPFLHAWLASAVALVNLRLEDAELVLLGLAAHAQPAVAAGAVVESRPEVGKLVDDHRVVADGSSQVAGLLAQQSPVEACQHVVGLQVEHEVEVLDAPVVVAHLSAEQSPVVVAQEVVRLQVEGGVVVGHGSPQVVLVVACQGAVDVVGGILGQQVDSLVEVALRLLPLAAREADDGADGPCLAVVGVEFETLVEGLYGAGGVFLEHVDLGTHGVARRVPGPPGEHGVEL